MSGETSIELTVEEIGLLLHWMYRAGASGVAASKLITKLQDAKKILKDQEES